MIRRPPAGDSGRGDREGDSHGIGPERDTGVRPGGSLREGQAAEPQPFPYRGDSEGCREGRQKPETRRDRAGADFRRLSEEAEARSFRERSLPRRRLKKRPGRQTDEAKRKL